MAQLPATRRFTVDEYYRMAAAGIFREDDRVELIDGEIVEMSPIGSRHAACVDALNGAFASRLAGVAIVRVQNPLHLDEHAEPQPDVALVRQRPDRYVNSHPTAADVLLVIEVADTTQTYDRGVKAGLYAAAGIGEYWMVDLQDGCVEVYRDPGPDGYRTLGILRRGERLSPAALPQVELEVDAILG